MTHIPASMSKHIEVVCPLEGGGFVVGASSLTGRYWTGSIWYWKNEESVPDIEKCTAACEVHSTIGDLTVFGPTQIMVATDSGSVELYKLAESENGENVLTCVAQPCEHDDVVTTLSVNSTHETSVTGSNDCRIKLWNIEDSVCVNTFYAHSGPINDVTYHPSQSDVFVSCSQDGRVLLWDTRKPKPATLIDVGVQDIVTCVEWKPAEEHRIVVGTESGTVHVQDVRKAVGAQLTTYPHTRPVTRMNFSQKRNDWLATASEDCSITVQNVTNDDLAEVWRSNAHKDFARCAAWSRSEERLYSCSWDGSVLSHRVQPNVDQPASVENMETDNAVVNGD